MSVDAHGIAVLESEVRELVRRRGVDPARDRTAVDRLVRDAIADYETRSAIGAVVPLADLTGAGRAVVDAVAGLGPLQQYSTRPRRRGDLDQRAIGRNDAGQRTRVA